MTAPFPIVGKRIWSLLISLFQFFNSNCFLCGFRIKKTPTFFLPVTFTTRKFPFWTFFFFLKSTCCFLTTGYFHNYFQLLLSITDENQSTCYFRLLLLLSVCKKHCGLLDVASWLTSCSYHHFKLSNRGIFRTRKSNRCSSYNFLLRNPGIPFCVFQRPPPSYWGTSKVSKGVCKKKMHQRLKGLWDAAFTYASLNNLLRYKKCHETFFLGNI